jgi:site-specific DNA recombinase
VIGERIRDKFAASRKKGMWMGGHPPPGYQVKDRKLVVNDREAALVRQIFERFLRIGSVTILAKTLHEEGFTNRRGNPARQNDAVPCTEQPRLSWSSRA